MASYLVLAGVIGFADFSEDFTSAMLAVLFVYALATVALGRGWIPWLAPVPWLVVGLWIAMLSKAPLECDTCDSGWVGALFTMVFLVFLVVLVAAPIAAVVRLVQFRRQRTPYGPADGSA